MIQEVRDYLASGVPVGERLADQLLVPIAIAGSGSFLTGKLSRHTRTNIDVISKWPAPGAFRTEQTDNGWNISFN